MSSLILCALLTGGTGPARSEAPLLKPDVPKLDTPSESAAPEAKIKPRGPLRGGVQHLEKLNAQPRRLKGNATGGSLGGFLKGNADARRLRGKAGADLLEAQAESGIGIIGVKFVMFGQRPPVINRVFPGTPAAGVGLRIDDIIVAVDGVPTYGLTKEEVYDLIVGTPGTPVTLSVSRKGEFVAVTMNRMDLNDITDPFVRRDYMMSM
ncbi:MAG TPA: PDZ domain-containing protein [Candidatus Obscuribacterales bacterium]